MKVLSPVLTIHQWERVLTAHEKGQDIPELEPDATAGLILHQLGWFTHADARHLLHTADVLKGGLNQAAQHLAQMGSVKTNPQAYFQAQAQYENLKAREAWYRDMAVRIGALLPPEPLLQRLAKEKANESEGMEESHPG